MEFKNYDTLEYEKMEIISKLNLYDAYISVGVNKTDVGYIRPLTVNCGYSMGGQTKLFVNKKEVTTFSNEQEYSHSNRFHGREKHGLIILEFTKKDFKDLSIMFRNLFEERVNEDKCNKIAKLASEFVLAHINYSKSIIAHNAIPSISFLYQ